MTRLIQDLLYFLFLLINFRCWLWVEIIWLWC